MRPAAVLIDLGGTLVRYADQHEFPAILETAIDDAREVLRGAGIAVPSPSEVEARFHAKVRLPGEHAVRHLGQRLADAFALPIPVEPDLRDRLCRAFMRSFFARGTLYDDALPTLHLLRRHRIRTAIVSNTAWGSPGYLWREELDRHGISPLVDTTVFCTDVGWRKPDSRVFHHTLELLGIGVGDAVFVGDDPRWDIDGPTRVGMRAILLRRSAIRPVGPDEIASLRQLPSLLGLCAR